MTKERLGDIKVEDCHQWAISMDKGYHGITREVRGIIPENENKWVYFNSRPTLQQKMASDTTIVKNVMVTGQNFGQFWMVVSDIQRIFTIRFCKFVVI